MKFDKGFKSAFPHMIEQLNKGNVWAWDNYAYTRELTTEHIKHIAELKKQKLEVYAVLDNHMQTPDGEVIHMTSYLFDEVGEYDRDTYYAMADVINHTWGIQEKGSVLIKRCPAGGPRRVG